MYLSIYRLTPRKREVEENLRTLGTTTANFYNLQEYRSVSNQRQVGFPPSIWEADAKTFSVEDGWIISSQEGARYRHTWVRLSSMQLGQERWLWPLIHLRSMVTSHWCYSVIFQCRSFFSLIPCGSSGSDNLNIHSESGQSLNLIHYQHEIMLIIISCWTGPRGKHGNKPGLSDCFHRIWSKDNEKEKESERERLTFVLFWDCASCFRFSTNLSIINLFQIVQVGVFGIAGFISF